MKLLVVAQKLDLSESALLCRLQEAGHELFVVLDPDDKKIRDLESAKISLLQLRIRNRIDLNAIRVIRKILVQEDFRVGYSSFNGGLSCLNFASIGTKCRTIGYRGTLGNISPLDPSSYLTYLHPSVSQIICNCEAVRTFLLGIGIPDSRLRVIFKGHDPSWYQPKEEISRKMFALPEGVPIIGCTANFRSLKGIPVVIEAFAGVVKHSNAHLVLVGEERTSTERILAKKLGLHERIHFFGYREDARAISSLFDIAVMASLRREGVPRAIVEAMSQQVPCVVSDVGGLPELVENNQTGLIVPAGDVTAMQTALLQLLENAEQRRAFGRAGLRRVEERFSLNTYTTKMSQLFLQVEENSLSQAAHSVAGR